MKSNKVCAIIGNYYEYKALNELVEKRPLATIPFDGKYRLVDFQLSSLANANIRQVFLALHHYQITSMLDHIGSGKEWGLDNLTHRYFMGFYEQFESRRAQGKNYTAHILDFLKKSESEITVLMSSNVVANIDLKPFIDLHRKNGKNISVLYKKTLPENLASVHTILSLKEDKQFVENAHQFDPEIDTQERVNFGIGIYIINTAWLIQTIEANFESYNEDAPLSLQAALPKLLAIEETEAFEYIGYLTPIHDVKSYYDANMDMLDSVKFNALLYSNNRVFTKVKNEVPTYFAQGSVVRNAQFASGSIIEGEVVNSIISRNNQINAGSSVNHSIIFPGGTIHNGAKIEYAILDKNVVVEKGVVIKGTKDNPIVIRKNSVVTANVTA